MAANLLTCPHCRAMVRSARSAVANTEVRCPECGSHFNPATNSSANGHTPAVSSEVTQPPRFTVAKEGAIALAVAIALAGGGITTALLLTRERPTPAPVADQEPPIKQKDDERLQLEAERKSLEQEKRKLDIARQLSQAGTLLAERKYADAEKAYGEVLKLAPEEGEAIKGLVNVRVALAAETRAAEDKSARDMGYARLMSQGKEAMDKKQFLAAVRLFTAAQQARPGDPDATAGLTDAEQALIAEDMQKKTLAEYQAHMDSGKAALAAKRYQDAIQSFIAAQRVQPTDEAVANALKQAQDRLKDQEDREKRQAQFAGLMERGNFAMRNRRYDTAVTSFEGALKLFPDDREARQALQEANKAKKQARSEFNKLMAQANQAMQNQRIEEAARAYAGASALFPDDMTAARMVKQVDRLLESLQTNQAAYVRFVTQGGLALRTGRYADAARAYADALRIVPNDPEAILGLREAQANLNGVIVQAADYQQLMTAGAQAMRLRRYPDAVKAYTDALTVAPGDVAANTALRQARYQQAMAQGQAAMFARRYNDAIRAFQDALREVPGDFQAQVALRNAQTLRR